MHRRDRRLELVRPHPTHPQRPVHQRPALHDRCGVPPPAVLVLEAHQLAGEPLARGSARVREQLQREQADDLRLVGQQLRHDPRHPDRLGAQLAADERVAGGRVIALIEHQVQHAQHGLQALGEAVRGRNLVRDAGLADLALRPDEALGERRLGHEEGASDLGRREPAERAQGQGDRGLGRERRVAAGEDQPELVVRDRGHLVLRGGEQHRLPAGRLERLVTGDRRGLVRESARAPRPVDGTVAGRRRDPRARVGRDAVRGPALERDDVRVRDRLLGEVEVAEDPDQRRDRPPVLLAEGTGDGIAGRGIGDQPNSTIGRTSILPNRAPGTRAAASMAASRSFASIR